MELGNFFYGLFGLVSICVSVKVQIDNVTVFECIVLAFDLFDGFVAP